MIGIVLGTRPEIIKTAPIAHELHRRHTPFRFIHTGQHYSPQLDRVFFHELGLPEPIANLEIGSMAPVHQVAKMMSALGDTFAAHELRAVLVQGDTNSVLAAGLAAHKMSIPVAHLEGGLRSDDWTMPEEGNRVLVGRLAAVHFCPTEIQAARLAREGITRGVYVVGNTVVDACLQFSERARAHSDVVARLGLRRGAYGLVTLHRPSNVDNHARFAALAEGLAEMARSVDAELVFPMHPRTRTQAQAQGIMGTLARKPFVTVEPVGYLDMLALLADARFVVTDSGGLQEEACTLHVPCVTLRSNTERPETVDVGANILCDATDPAELRRALLSVSKGVRKAENPFGDGKTAGRVVDILLSPHTRWLPSGQP